MKKLFLGLLLLATLGISACVTAGGVQTSTEQELPVPDISNLKPKWIEGDCRSMAMTAESHSTCIAYLASQLPPFDPNKREYFGEDYNPGKFLECALKQSQGIDGACERYRLRRIDNPEYWPYPDVPKPKWPEAPKESVYKPGMNSKQYFEALCKAEAGEFIYKTVENVEGIYQVRPRSRLEYYDYPQQDRYVLEDPFSYTDVEASSKPEDYFIQPALGQYQFFERPTPDGQYQYFWRDDQNSKGGYQTAINGKPQTVPYVVSSKTSSSLSAYYGYVWRGVARLYDRDNKIAGGELAVIDLKTNEILAIRRGFARGGDVRNSPTGIYWHIAERCPTDSKSVAKFIYKVLKPHTAGKE